MKKFEIAGFCYAAFAILAAYTALAPIETTVASRSDHQTNVAAPSRVVRDSQRLADADEEDTAARRAEYTVVIWTGDYCTACQKYKQWEVPTLLKLGYKVVLKDFFKDGPPEEIKVIPTIQLLHKGQVIRTEVYWKAKDLDKFVLNRLALKK
jgi:hypothetical protein